MRRLKRTDAGKLLLPAGSDLDYNRLRGSAAARGYDERWRVCRESYLAQHPLCEDCCEQGRIVAAQEVHHVVPLKAGGERLDHGNLRSLCRSCHKRAEHAFNRGQHTGNRSSGGASDVG